MKPDGDASPGMPGASPERRTFPTTQWSLVVNAGVNSEPDAYAALESLCRQYWYPLYGFIRRQGRPHHEAQDCTQEFLARLLATGAMSAARPERGRFRTFLLTALRNFLTNEWHRARASKRGAGAALLSLDFHDADRAFILEPPDSARTPEQTFDHTWALGLIERSIADVRSDYEKSGRGALFAALVPLVWGDDSAETLAAPATRLGLTTAAFTVALHRLRQRVGQRLRAAVAETVAGDAEVDEELRHLIATVNGHYGR